MQEFNGIPAANGIAIGQAFSYQKAEQVIQRTQITNVDQELVRLDHAIAQAQHELEEIYQEALDSVGQETADIFQAHLMMLQDPELLSTAKEMIQTEQVSADTAFYETSEMYAEMLQNLPDEYLQARAADVRDISSRVVRILQGGLHDNSSLLVPSIVLAEDLAPSDTIQFERNKLLGFVTAKGGTTSHTAILSRALGIPAIVGVEGLVLPLPSNVTVILDGEQGLLILDPDENTLSHYEQKKQLQNRKQELERVAAQTKAVTLDGHHVEVVSNIGSFQDVESALQNGAEGVGLFRTEFSYLEQSTTPSEEQLVETYQEIFQSFGDKPIVVRTLDIGGDKEIPHLGLPKESNPFLGHRGIRLCLSRPDLFKPQLRAVLRAGAESNLCIMFPMVATVEEVRQAKTILAECKAELAEENLVFNATPQVGVMIEVPSAVIIGDQLANEVDFFSIGTNDLTQYTMAVDRTNANVSYLVSAFQPAVMRLIKQAIDHAHDAGIWVGMCGEMAGEPKAIPVLLGMGLDEFSMNAPAIPQVKAIIREWKLEDAQALAEKALACASLEEVLELLDSNQ